MSDLCDLDDWIATVSGPGIIWYAKRLSGNDTWANGSRADEFCIPATVFVKLFPAAFRGYPARKTVQIRLEAASYGQINFTTATRVSKLAAGSDLAIPHVQIAGIGGPTSPLLDPENTGALTVFAAPTIQTNAGLSCSVWVCRDAMEENLLEGWLGPVEPGHSVVWSRSSVTTYVA